jgi:hypothetical protein
MGGFGMDSLKKLGAAFCLAVLVGVGGVGYCADMEVAGVVLAPSQTMADGTEVVLNGAGVRSKFFFKIYVAALYLEQRADSTEAVLATDGARRMAMHFLYDEVSAEQLVEAWNDGFTANGSDEQISTLATEIEAFNALFTTVRAGDVIMLDYLPGGTTSVWYGDEMRGEIGGKDFNDLLLSIWLGEKPVTTALKKALLGQ